MLEDIAKVLITADEVKTRVSEIGRAISDSYRGRNLLLISVLKGSFVFMADLVRAITVPLGVDFMVVSSFVGAVSSGAVRIEKDIGIPIENRDVLLVEDILDSGRTLEYLSGILRGRGPRSLSICTLLDKPSRRLAVVVPDYVGFTVPDEFVVGYGLDYNERYRNLPFIGVLKSEIYAGQK